MIGNSLEIIQFLEKEPNDIIYNLKKITNKNLVSRGQQKYYWGVVVKVIGNYHGLTPIETNESLKTMFNCETFTDLSTSEFKFLIDSIIEMWETKYSVKIPLPIDSGLEKSLMECLY